MDYEIDVIYEAENEFLPVSKQVQKLISAILTEHDTVQAEVSVAFVNDVEIVELNKKYFNKTTTTDVIAFDLLEECEDSRFIDYDHVPESSAMILTTCKLKNKIVEGEIIVNANRAREVSDEYGNTAYQETMLYVIHGLLHILGYDDLEDEKKRIMWVFQDYYFEKYVKSDAS